MSVRPTVRFITRKWAPAVGGMETYCLELTDRIKDDVTLDIHALPGRPDGSPPSGFQIIGFGLKMAAKLLVLPKMDVTHVSEMASWPLGLLAKLRRPKTRLVLSAHGSDLSFEQRAGVLPKFYSLYMRLGAKLLPRAIVLANSKWIAELATSKGFRDVRCVPLATDMKPPETPPAQTQDLIYAGRIMQSKGTSFIINDVLPLLPDTVGLRVAGTIWEQAEGAALEHPRVTYLGRLSPEELAKEYAAALAVVVPSIAPEGFGLVAAEAAIAGGVVIASDHSGLSDVCAGGIGHLAPPQDAKAWAAKIKDLMSLDKEARAKMTAKSQKQAKARYSWSRVAYDTLAAYEAAI